MSAGAPPEALGAALDAFIARVRAAPEVAAAAARCGLAPGQAENLLGIYTNEAPVGLGLVAPLLRPGLRVLEVGCGIGVLARFLLDRNVDLTGIEPGAAGFGFMPEIGAAIRALEPARGDAGWLTIGAEKLDPAAHGKFDLIYSVNVLEHIPDLDAAFAGMARVLAPGGAMIHMCPNYFVPYEPHFGIPLIPFAPRATQRLFPRTVKKYPGIWEELNFISARRVRALARANALTAEFERGVLSRMLRRATGDAHFRARQGGAAALGQRAVSGLGLAGLIERLPGEYLTPMVFRAAHVSGAAR